jgi:glycosyltransferase involved in cell wall biosynthesis
MKKLSVVIPSYKDPLLPKTINSLLENSELGDQLEVIATLDGYWPDSKTIVLDPRVKYVHHGKNRGMREAINSAVDIASGEYLMRTDEHATFCPGYDRILTSDIEDNWIVTPRRYFLDTEKWEVMDIPPVDYMKLKIVRIGGDKEGWVEKFSGVEWPSRAKERKDIMIDETMAMQGSCWVMPHKWWKKVIVRLQSDGYGTHYQDSHEMQFKTWKAGVKLMVNKNAWHAHKHRKFPRTHGYGGKPARDGFAYALKIWRDYYEKEILPKWNV